MDRYAYLYNIELLSDKIHDMLVERYNLNSSHVNVVVFDTSINVSENVFCEYLKENGIPKDCKIHIYKDLRPTAIHDEGMTKRSKYYF